MSSDTTAPNRCAEDRNAAKVHRRIGCYGALALLFVLIDVWILTGHHDGTFFSGGWPLLIVQMTVFSLAGISWSFLVYTLKCHYRRCHAVLHAGFSLCLLIVGGLQVFSTVIYGNSTASAFIGEDLLVPLFQILFAQFFVNETIDYLRKTFSGSPSVAKVFDWLFLRSE